MGHSGRAMVVCGDREIGVDLVDALSKAGWASVVHATGTAALEEPTLVQCELVCVSRELADGDGISLLRKLRTRLGGVLRLGVVLVETDRPEVLQDCLRRGADDFLVVPSRRATLSARVEILSRRVAQTRGLEQAERAAREALARTSAMASIFRSIVASESSEAIARDTLERLGSLIGYDGAAVMAFDFERDRGELLANAGRFEPWWTRDQPVTVSEWSLDFDMLRGRTRHCPRLETDERSSALDHRLAALEFRSYLHVPLVGRAQLLGSVLVAAMTEDAFDATAVATLEDVGASMATALADEKLLEQVQQLASEDDLTGLANRRRLAEVARMELARARRYRRPLAVVMVDVDHFKRVNDRYGHAVGDEVLQGLATTMLAGIREIDLAVRFGGEELVMLLSECGLEAAWNTAERFRITVAETGYPTAAGPVGVTVSAGVAGLQPDDDSLDDLLNRADAALYRAKTSGRNRVEFA